MPALFVGGVVQDDVLSDGALDVKSDVAKFPSSSSSNEH